MRKKQKIPMVLPQLKSGRPSVGRRARSGDRRTTTEASRPYDEKLFEALRAWRREKAAVMGNVPAFIIYPDRTLEELARVKPQSEAELLEVRGIGPAKARQFGAETLGIIRKFGQR